MNRRIAKLVALLMTLAMLLSGCQMVNWPNAGGLSDLMATPFDQMEYTRPDMDALRQALEECMAASETATNAVALQEKIVNEFDAKYYSFYTNYNLASIYYFKDMTDTYWETEYNYCLQNSAEVDAAVEELYDTLADCPLKEELEKLPYFGEGFFDAYEGESIWDDEFVALLDREAELESQYYQLSEEAQSAPYYSEAFFQTYGTQMAELFVELIEVRQAQATHAGYDSYQEFAYDFHHSRDYTPEQGELYLEQVSQELTPLYRRLVGNSYDVYEKASVFSSEKSTYAYVKGCAKEMGGTFEKAFQRMERDGLYDISYGEDKYDASFEVYLLDYSAPYVFVNPRMNQWDKLTFAHEFGHFCSDYASYGSVVGVDVAEVFSQGMEYLSLCYNTDGSDLAKIKMVDCLSLHVEQSAYALFEHRVYDLEGEELTVENVQAVYEEIGMAFGFDMWDWDSRDYVLISHFFTEPLYVISYVVSNDGAFQIYQMELAEPGKGLALLEESLDTESYSLLAFFEEAGLTNPFTPGRVATVADTLEDIIY